MIQHGARRTVEAAVADTWRAETHFDQARAWLDDARARGTPPLAAEAWVFDTACRQVLLVRHRWRGWVCPGGRVEDESGETPRAAANRELAEETGLCADLFAVPAAAFVRSYRADWTPTLGLAYATVVDSSVPVIGEPRQPAAWVPLDYELPSAFPEDKARLLAFAERLSRTSTCR